MYIYQVLEKLVASEQRYFNDLRSLVDIYYKQFKIAIASGHMAISWTKLDAMFLNWWEIALSFMVSKCECSRYTQMERWSSVTYLMHMVLYIFCIQHKSHSPPPCTHAHTAYSITSHTHTSTPLQPTHTGPILQPTCTHNITTPTHQHQHTHTHSASLY